MMKKTLKKGRGLVETLESLLQLFSVDQSVEKVSSQYKVHAHDNTLPNGVNNELDVWTDNEG